MSSDLRHALAFVEGVLEEAEKDIGPAPKFADSTYFSRRKVVMDRCAVVLTDRLGARITDSWNGCRVRIAGLSSSCTAGMSGALQNWLTAARRKIASPSS